LSISVKFKYSWYFLFLSVKPCSNAFSTKQYLLYQICIIYG
jgi:hypothetical protein